MRGDRGDDKTLPPLKPTMKEEEMLEVEQLKQLKARLPELEVLLEKLDSHWHGEDSFYRFYHHSSKV